MNPITRFINQELLPFLIEYVLLIIAAFVVALLLKLLFSI